VRYLKPLYADLVAEAWLEPASDWEAVLRSVAERGRARAGIAAHVLDADVTAVAVFTGRFAAFRGG
jgi:hypothetical protein